MLIWKGRISWGFNSRETASNQGMLRVEKQPLPLVIQTLTCEEDIQGCHHTTITSRTYWDYSRLTATQPGFLLVLWTTLKAKVLGILKQKNVVYPRMLYLYFVSYDFQSNFSLFPILWLSSYGSVPR